MTTSVKVCKFPEKVKKRMAGLTTEEWVAERIKSVKNRNSSAGGEQDRMEVDDFFDDEDVNEIDSHPDAAEVWMYFFSFMRHS